VTRFDELVKKRDELAQKLTPAERATFNAAITEGLTRAWCKVFKNLPAMIRDAIQ
jgi:hypothetical protein